MTKGRNRKGGNGKSKNWYPSSRSKTVDAQQGESDDDTDSVTSSLGSDMKSHDGDETGELSSQEQLEEKLRDYIDMFVEKSMSTRVNAMEGFMKALSRNVLPAFVDDRKVTIFDALLRCLKKGKGHEQELAVSCMLVELLQLGSATDADDMYKQLQPLLVTILLDDAAAYNARAMCATGLSHMSFHVVLSTEELSGAMSTLEKVFKASGKTPPELAKVKTSALNGWALLLTMASESILEDASERVMKILIGLLETTYLELKLAAGEAIALIYEKKRAHNEYWKGPRNVMVNELTNYLTELSKEYNKTLGKKFCRVQRSTFRDILATVEGNSHRIEISFGGEKFDIVGWEQLKKYNSVCLILGSGINAHLAENDYVQHLLELGGLMFSSRPVRQGASKLERHCLHQAVFKARTQVRKESRNKRQPDVYM